MIRQLGSPTFFVTFSAAESRWVELLIILEKILNNKILSKEDVEKLSFEDKSYLIQNDPVTCARYFQHRFNLLLNSVILSEFKPLGKVIDYYYRVEFQHRGSPHVHMFLWVENSPNLQNGINDTEVIDFVDKYIHCDKYEDGDEKSPISYQIHKHSKSCRRRIKGKNICRFNIPFPPMIKTVILYPNPKNKSIDRKNYEKIRNLLNSSSMNDVQNFEEFLTILELSNDDYLQAISTSIKKPTLFLKRNINAIRVNPYNKHILDLWKANTDIQFILSPYECVQYVLNYLQKSERGMSLLLRETVEEIKRGNFDVKDKLRKICNTFMNGTEIGAQEVVYLLLNMPVSVSSRATTFVNTSPPEERVRLLKSEKEIEMLSDENEDIMVAGIIEHYTLRPKTLEEISLAEFATNFNFIGKKNEKFKSNDEENKRSSRYRLMDGSGDMIKRRKSKILRYRKYNFHSDPENYLREQLMLFIPWRIETNFYEMDVKIEFEKNKTQIENMRKLYIFNDNIEKILDDPPQNEFTQIFSNSDTENYETEVIEEIEKFDFKREIEQNCGNNLTEKILKPKLIEENDFQNLILTLNEKQYKYLLYILSIFKNNNEPKFYNFVSGGAGVGKSLLIKAIYQSLCRYFNSIPGHNGDETNILLSAFTGKAAFNINGMTLHTTFGLPINQCGGKMVRLDESTANTMRNKLNGLKLLIIDEISMVGATIFKYLDERLRQIFHSTEIFAGISIIAVGDFNQLSPVGDSMIFQTSKRDEYETLAGPCRWEMFNLFELDEIMRQKEDLSFAQALNNLANNCMTKSDIELFNSRCVKKDTLFPSE